MLYDKRWDKTETKPDVFSLESLIAWLETMPAGETYDFFCTGECMVGRWVLSIDPAGGPAQNRSSDYYYVNGKLVDLSPFVRIANSGSDHFTFGAALERARARL